MKGIFTFGKLVIFWIVYVGHIDSLKAADIPIVLTNTEESVRIYKHLSYLEDATHVFTIDSLLQSPHSFSFTPFTTDRLPDLGSTASAIWLRLTVVNQSNKDWALEISNPLLEEVNFYKTSGTTIIGERQAGFFYPDAKQDIKSNFYIFSLFSPEYSSKDTITCYIRIVNSMPMQLPMQIATIRTLYEENHPIDVANGVYLGIILVMVLYNLFIYTSVRDKTYLFYVGYVLCSGIVIADFQGYVFDLVWKHTFKLFPVFDYVPVMLANILGLLFAWNFLATPSNTPKMHKGIQILLIGTVCVLIMGFGITIFRLSFYKVWCELAIQVVVFCSSVYMLGVGALLVSRNKRPAVFYVLAWTVFLVGTIIFILQIDGFIPNTFFTEHSVQIGSAVETILLSLALADRINTYKKEREDAQLQYIKQLQENEHVRNRIARDLHDDIGSTLSSIAILSQVARQRSLKSEYSGDILEKMSNSAQKMMDSLHDIVWTTQPANDSLNSITIRMREFAGEVLEAKNILYEIKVDEILLPLKLPTKRHYDFYMIFKESINNAAKYSEATHILVNLDKVNGHLRLQIQDNGKGFDIDQIKPGNGLKNMQKRAFQLEGNLHLSSNLGKGTFIEISIPITQ
ncbi:7TM diverse intracellular signaling domain-containing protein [Xanthocytophaga agilis]|uniref:histidine kinase n=1 Tax=Xanthocytophaga agilis TaxID=3048010 RepID=A0AAE3UIH9_9BACT|nr:7TM diverse intracellular signaling domain-containing protein [Xanthocytophaga agilis]MDJ1503748.1 7TM diverse intracellular signaling domain-containing protein [Xanthocytophaga agilis]